MNKNPYLYDSKVEDWADNHNNIWRLSLKLTMYEWGEVKKYFKYYRNRNLVGWGTTSPLEVTEILLGIRGEDSELQSQLKQINKDLHKIHQRQLDGYGQWDDWDWKQEEVDLYDERQLNSQKRELLGLA